MKMQDFFTDVDLEKLKLVLEIQRKYNENKISLEEAKKFMKEKIKILKPYEIALAEQELKKFSKDECKKEHIQEMLILYEDILDRSIPKLNENHPIMKYYLENKKLKELLVESEKYAKEGNLDKLYNLYNRIYKWKIHLVRKQNQLYSVLERKGFDRPTTTMWVLDDFLVDEMKKMLELIPTKNIQKIYEFENILRLDLLDLMSKEETILYPTSLAMINNSEFEYMKSGDNEIGFFEVEKNILKNKKEIIKENSNFTKDLGELLSKYGFNNKDELEVSNGLLSLEQINFIFKNLPIDISYVDENDIVKFYNDTEHRIFPRSKNAIGRNVVNCHPQKSVHIVQEIIDKFKNGEQNEAEFWINKEDIFIYIKYIAIRDENAKFRGILEIMQDVTHIRNLEGSRKLLTWEKENKKIEEKVELKTKIQNDEKIVITEETKLSDLLNKYPKLKGDLSKISYKFKMINTPLGRIMIPKATIKVMSERSGIELSVLITKLKEIIKEY